MSFDHNHWNRVKHELIQHADNLAYGAGMNGSYSDGGCAALKAKIATFEAGLAQQIPEEWLRIVAPRLDPEYKEFERLKAKFGK